MQYFRSEIHLSRWLERSGIAYGQVVGVPTVWELARAWYAGRLSPSWSRRTAPESQNILAKVGLTHEFWNLIALDHGQRTG
ncbi:MAG: hypothetical protein GIW99_11945 [Candidatus Eremiobacteraeota bacterium]|nr:hypothetical protein [Candidatus Eremiobacteraeota bacterium]MBC5828372.1 hypothetical protein [Candidatus Eremiobacteraeota bacterium]